MTLSNVEAPGVRGSPKLCGEEEERDGVLLGNLMNLIENQSSIEHCSKSTTKCPLIKLYQGDGESLPDTPPNEAAIVHQDSKVKNDNKTAHPFSLDIKVFSTLS